MTSCHEVSFIVIAQYTDIVQLVPFCITLMQDHFK